MTRPSFLRFKSKYYILLLGIIHILGFSFLFSYNSSGNNIKNNTFNSVKKVKEINDTIKKVKPRKVSISDIKKKYDSIARLDSINIINLKKNSYGSPAIKCMYGVTPNFNNNK
jgi:hypothetical protein